MRQYMNLDEGYDTSLCWFSTVFAVYWIIGVCMAICYSSCSFNFTRFAIFVAPHLTKCNLFSVSICKVVIVDFSK